MATVAAALTPDLRNKAIFFQTNCASNARLPKYDCDDTNRRLNGRRLRAPPGAAVCCEIGSQVRFFMESQLMPGSSPVLVDECSMPAASAHGGWQGRWLHSSGFLCPGSLSV